MAFQGALATIESFRNRLGIAADTLSAQEILTVTALLEDTSGMIERASGRRLRRRHSATEYFPGGGPLIRTSMTHIAKIHSIRESYTRDFDDSDKYDELVEGTDYVIETGAGGETPGESGILRRLNGTWMGSQSSPGQVQVIYTAGFKTEQETALEGVDVVFNSADQIANYLLSYAKQGSEDAVFRYRSPSSGELSISDMTIGGVRAVGHTLLRVDTDGVILPTWLITSISVVVYVKRREAGDHPLKCWTFSTPDPLSSDFEAVFDAIEAATDELGSKTADNESYEAWTIAMTSRVDIAYFASQIQNGYLCFAFETTSTQDPLLSYLAATDYAVAAERPVITVSHQPLIHSDVFNVPQDLRNACLLQAVHEYQTRRSPGFKTQSARGVAIASGASYAKDLAGLLPEVLAVAESYRRFV